MILCYIILDLFVLLWIVPMCFFTKEDWKNLKQANKEGELAMSCNPDDDHSFLDWYE